MATAVGRCGAAAALQTDDHGRGAAPRRYGTRADRAMRSARSSRNEHRQLEHRLTERVGHVHADLPGRRERRVARTCPHDLEVRELGRAARARPAATARARARSPGPRGASARARIAARTPSRAVASPTIVSRMDSDERTPMNHRAAESKHRGSAIAAPKSVSSPRASGTTTAFAATTTSRCVRRWRSSAPKHPPRSSCA